MFTEYLHSHFAPAFFFLPRERREALQCLYAVCRVLDDAVDKPSSNPRVTLQAWRQFIEQEDPSVLNLVGQYRIGARFLTVMKRFDIPKFSILDLIKGVEADIDFKPFRSPIDTENYCYGVAGTVGIACLPLFGVPWEQGKNFAVRLGIAIQWINIIRDVGTDADLGRVYLPQDHLEKFGCSIDDVLHRRLSPSFTELMKFEGGVAKSHYRRAMDMLPSEWKRELRPATIMGKIYLKLLEKTERQSYPVLEKRVSLNLFEKGYATLGALRE